MSQFMQDFFTIGGIMAGAIVLGIFLNWWAFRDG